MWNRNKHKIILINLLREIYRSPDIRTALGFKGGTAALLLYDLPRLSVDLDFDLLDAAKKDAVIKKIKNLADEKLTLVDEADKRFTIFFLFSYGKDTKKIKIEVSKRPTLASYELKNYLGLPLLAMKKEDIAADKLACLLTRKKLASRDLFDLWFFLKNDWRINEAILKEKTGLKLPDALKGAEEIIKKIPNIRLLHGLGELLDSEKQKDWVRKNLKEELLFQIELLVEVRTSDY